MAEGINDRILRILKEKTGGDESARKCLEELLFFEVEKPPFFKDVYLKTIEKYAKKVSSG